MMVGLIRGFIHLEVIAAALNDPRHRNTNLVLTLAWSKMSYFFRARYLWLYLLDNLVVVQKTH